MSDEPMDPDAVYVTREPKKEDIEREMELAAMAEMVSKKNRRPDSGRSRSSGGEVPLWLISFTDVIALMLTFFVLLFSMSQPKQEVWSEIKMALVDQFASYYSEPLLQGRLDFIDLSMISFQSALDLTYLETLLSTAVEQEANLKDVKLTNQGTHLVLSFPEQMLFNSGDDALKQSGRDAIFSLSAVLSGMSNRIEIVGHADPSPVSSSSRFSSNWDLSLSRAISVAAQLRERGYDREMRIVGASSGRYGDLSEKLSVLERKQLSRRVDIIIMEDDGRKVK